LGYGSWLFFFFQAEDGIRDWSVTGVQTCALPIWVIELGSPFAGWASACLTEIDAAGLVKQFDRGFAGLQLPATAVADESGYRWRSEERRVGKEGRVGGWRERGKKRARREAETATA